MQATRVSPALQTPMGYFISNLSFLDICYVSTTILVMPVNFFPEKKTISYEGCPSQIFLLVTWAGFEGVFLAAMAYDHYVAICHPLQYGILMSVKVCVCLMTWSWMCGLVNSGTHTVLTATITLYEPKPDPLLALRHPIAPEALLLRHFCQWVCAPLGQCHCWPEPLPVYCSIWHTHHFCYPSDSFSSGPEKDLFYLGIPPHRGSGLLWDIRLQLWHA